MLFSLIYRPAAFHLHNISRHAFQSHRASATLVRSRPGLPRGRGLVHDFRHAALDLGAELDLEAVKFRAAFVLCPERDCERVFPCVVQDALCYSDAFSAGAADGDWEEQGYSRTGNERCGPIEFTYFPNW